MNYRPTASYVRRPPARRRRPLVRLVAVLCTVLVLGVGSYALAAHLRTPKTADPPATAPTSANAAQQAAQTPPPNMCAGNTEAHDVLVSISKRHMWACAGSAAMYDSAVVTGMENLPADLTPTGTYHIYAKQTNLYLDGSDSTGSWHDWVNYWMPFLSNQYGVYGFHDATWRKDSDFGTIDPYSGQASHGCVELPLAAAKWLYNWAPIGTTVTIVS